MSPPPGITQLWNFSLAGSKRTMVFGLAPDSLYQTAALVKTIPYGSDLGPLGDGHSVTLPVVASSRPKKPRAKSVYQIISSGPIAMRRGRAPASGSGYSVICIVLLSMLATLLVPKSTKNTTFLELSAMPDGRGFGGGEVARFIWPVAGSSRPTMLACWTVNHKMPSRSKMRVCGSFASGAGIGYSVTAPLLGSSLPISAALLPVNQMLPSLSSVRPCGPVRGVLRSYSFIAPVLGSSRPSLLASCPVHQSAPSLLASGSCGREPGVGTGHSLMTASTGPGRTTAAGRALSGKLLMRYSVTLSH